MKKKTTEQIKEMDLVAFVSYLFDIAKDAGIKNPGLAVLLFLRKEWAKL